jgi:hypothetical protein
VFPVKQRRSEHEKRLASQLSDETSVELARATILDVGGASESKRALDEALSDGQRSQASRGLKMSGTARNLSTPIASMIKRMNAEGVAFDVIVQAVEAVETRGTQARSQAVSTTKRGTRLPQDWRPSPAAISYAADRGMTSEHIRHEAEKFSNYWRSKTGAGATKVDWDATWRNWILTTLERSHAPPGRSGNRTYSASGHPPTGADAVMAGMGRLASRVAERRVSTGRDRPAPPNADIAPRLDLDGGSS